MKSAGQVNPTKALKGLVASTLDGLAKAIEHVSGDALKAIPSEDLFKLVERAAFATLPKAQKATLFNPDAKAALDASRREMCYGVADFICRTYSGTRNTACDVLGRMTIAAAKNDAAIRDKKVNS